MTENYFVDSLCMVLSIIYLAEVNWGLCRCSKVVVAQYNSFF